MLLILYKISIALLGGEKVQAWLNVGRGLTLGLEMHTGQLMQCIQDVLCCCLRCKLLK